MIAYGPFECESCLSMVIGGDLLHQLTPSMTGMVPTYSCPNCEQPMFYINLDTIPAPAEQFIQDWIEEGRES